MHSTFTGKSQRSRQVNLSGQRNTNPWATASTGWPASSGAGAPQTVANALAEREKRQKAKEKKVAAAQISQAWKRHKDRKLAKQQSRDAWDAMYGTDAISDPSQLTSALSLLLSLFDARVPADQRRLDQFARSLSLAGPNLADSGCLDDARWEEVAPLLVDALERRDISDSYSQHLLGLLVDIIVGRPFAIVPVLDRYYRLILEYCNGPNGRRLPRLAEAVAAPLSSRSPRAYEVFAFRFLTSPRLAMVESSPSELTRLVNLQSLSQSVINVYSQRRLLSSREELLWLLAHFIQLNRALPTSQGSAYLEALYRQLSVLVADIRSQSARQEDDLGGSKSKQPEPLPQYVWQMLEFLVDENGIAQLLGRFTSSRVLEDAGLLAGYTLILLRCFPNHADDIKMRLFQGDISTDGSEDSKSLPAVKFLWTAASRAKVFTVLAQQPLGPSSIGELLRPEPSQDQEWRTILLFLELYNFLLRVTDEEDFLPADAEVIGEQSPATMRIRASGLALEELTQLAKFLKNLLFPLYHDLNAVFPPAPTQSGLGSVFAVGSQPVERQERATPPPFAGIMGMDLFVLRSSASATMRSLYERDARRRYLPQDFWLMTSKFEMDSFVAAVVTEQMRRDEGKEGEPGDDEDSETDEDEDMIDAPSIPYHTSIGSRISRFAQLEYAHRQRRLRREHRIAQARPKLEVLRNMPFAIPFDVRVKIFRELVFQDKFRRRANFVEPDQWRLHVLNGGLFNSMTRRSHSILEQHSARIKRGQVFDDAMDQFYNLGEGLKEPIQITFIDQFDQPEAGIDGGGVTKEFLTSIVDEAFDSAKSTSGNRGLFVANKENLMYPNPAVYDESLVPSDLSMKYEFLGRIVGKCMYEGILIDIAFASFFLRRWSLSGLTGKEGTRATLYDVKEFDDELYRGLLSLKNYTGEVSDLALDFTINDQITSPHTHQKRTITHSLRENGENIPVTNSNRHLYIAYVTHYRLVQQLARQNKAFLNGLGTMINPSWLSMFNPQELQRLVGGDSSEIDVEDLRRHTEYSGVYVIGDDGLEHPTIQLFWQVMHSLHDTQRRQVLKYVTSTPRAPLLGFAQLQPAFSIRDSSADENRLPSVSTCVNLLKLPRYKTAQQLREKLLYAVQSGAGFDLS